MHAFKLRGQVFVISGEALEPSSPTKTALHHPALGQQYKTLPGFRQLHHFQLYAMGLDLPCRLLTRLALIHKGELDVLSGCLLDLLGKLAHLCAFLLIGRSHLQRQQMAQGGGTAMCTLLPLRRLQPLQPARPSFSGER